MATLTDEQRRRIEENKQKALAIRAAKLASGAPNILVSSANSNSSHSAAISAPINTPTLPLVVNNAYGSKSKISTGIPQCSNYGAFKKDSFQKQTTNTTQQVSKFYGAAVKPVIVNLVLVSKDRFGAEFTFNKTVIEILKTVRGKLYG